MTPWTHPLRTLALLALVASPALADDGVGVVPRLDAAYDDLPLEASRTATAVAQIASGDKVRVTKGLLDLEGLLALRGDRLEAVDDALTRSGAVAVLEAAEKKVKGKSMKLLYAELLEAVRSRAVAR